MRRATRAFGPPVAVCFISIHALHEESDKNIDNHPAQRSISIHALHEESDLSDLAQMA